jgi:hypothetical protein
MPLIKVPTVALYTGTESFVYIDPSTVNNIRPEPFELEGKTVDTVCFTAGRTTWNTPWSLKTFFVAMGRDHSDSVYENSKPLVVTAS